MIISLLELKPLPEKRQDILDVLRFVKERLLMERACLESAIYQGYDQDLVILYLERWQSREAMDRHIQSGVYLGVLNAMDLCREKPDIYFHEVLDTQGMERIAAIRDRLGDP